MLYIILPVYNRLIQTKEFLSSLYSQSFKDFKVVLVNDGSIDDTQEYINKNYPDIILLNGSGNLYWGGAINLGIDYVKKNANNHDLIAFANNDIIFVSESALLNIVTSCKNDKDNLHHSIVIDKNNICMSSGSRLLSWPLFLTKHPFRGKHINNINILEKYWVNLSTARFLIFHYTMFNYIGQINSKFPHYLGDVDFSYSLYRKKGIKTYIDTNSIVQLNSDTTGFNAGKIDTFKDFIKSLFSIKSSNNIIYRMKFAYYNTNILILPIFFFSSLIKIIISNFFIKTNSH